MFKFREENIVYTSGYKYQLSDDAVVNIPALKPYTGIATRYIAILPGAVLLIRKGYAWDGASGPTWDSKNSMRGSLVHDALYQLMRRDLVAQDFRKTADQLIYRICIADGMWRWRAKAWLWALRKLAGKCASPSSRRLVQFAPVKAKGARS